MNVFLFETQSFGGNSGSPVFFYLGADRRFGSLNVSAPIIKLAGVMKGTFQEGNPIQVAGTGTVPYSVANVGIAAVVPSYFLHDILYSDELVKQREASAVGDAKR